MPVGLSIFPVTGRLPLSAIRPYPPPMRRQDLATAEAAPNGEGTIGALRRAVAEKLRLAFRKANRGGTPDLDARLLVAAAARLDPAVVPLRDDKPADGDVARRAWGLVDRRSRGEPVARIVGRKEFWGLELALSSATLVPRPDTETVIEAALSFVAGRTSAGPLRILDLGTGSGAILLALLSELPGASGVGTDISPAAAALARENAVRLGFAERARFVSCDWMAAIRDGRFDLVVANPPYIPTADLAALNVEVRAHDPARALDGGPDGLAAVRTILADVGRVMLPGGAGFIEIGAGQRDEVARLAEAERLSATFVPDLAGIARVAVLVR